MVSPALGSLSPNPSAIASSSSSTTALRALVFAGSVPLAVSLAREELPINADLTVETYYIQAARHTYLPILLGQLRTHFLSLVLDESSCAGLSEDECWFAGSDGTPLRWHWPVGLLYDYHSHQGPNAPREAHAMLALEEGAKAPFALTLHLRDPPSDALLMGPSLEACKNTFMHMLKEADFVRWGTTKRVNNLRKEQQDALWDGLVQNDFEKYWAVASKLVPLPSSSRAPTPTPGQGSAGTGQEGRLPEANEVRSVPMRVYLPEGAPVLQDVVPPVVAGMATVKFCPECDNLLYPTEDKVHHVLRLACRNCAHTEHTTNPLVQQHILENTHWSSASVNEGLAADPTLPRTMVECPHCETKRACAFFQSRDRLREKSSMILTFLCATCERSFNDREIVVSRRTILRVGEEGESASGGSLSGPDQQNVGEAGN